MDTTIFGYRRENDAIGVRNHVVILPLDDLSNAAAEGVAQLIPGTLALPHPYGRLQFGEDLDLFFRTLIGTGSNPNVSAFVVIGIEPNWTTRVVRRHRGHRQARRDVLDRRFRRSADHRTSLPHRDGFPAARQRASPRARGLPPRPSSA